jgi:endonuclease/exonuclease/phosphatase (EEP) superfamily protein YafD
MIPIDHFLVSEDVAVTRFETGPRVGSDHLPIVADIRIGIDR